MGFDMDFRLAFWIGVVWVVARGFGSVGLGFLVGVVGVRFGMGFDVGVDVVTVVDRH